MFSSLTLSLSCSTAKLKVLVEKKIFINLCLEAFFHSATQGVPNVPGLEGLEGLGELRGFDIQGLKLKFVSSPYYIDEKI